MYVAKFHVLNLSKKLTFGSFKALHLKLKSLSCRALDFTHGIYYATVETVTASIGNRFVKKINVEFV